MSKTSKGAKAPSKRQYQQHEVKTKCEAVLAIWTERRKPAELCRELGINWPTLNGWQNKAMEGMLAALDNRREREEKPPPLSGPIAQRLSRNLQQRQNRLERRLSGLLEAPKNKVPIATATTKATGPTEKSGR